MRKSVLLFISVLVLAVGQTPAQTFIPTPVEISKDKVRTGGELYYVHKVLQGQTLFSIAKAYGLSQEELKENNASLSKGLKAGMLLYIPVNPKTAPVAEPAPDKPAETAPVTVEASAPITAEPVPVAPPKAEPVTVAPPKASVDHGKAAEISETGTSSKPAVPDRKFRKHTVRWYETLGDVAVYYDIPVDALAALNGLETDATLRRRQVLLVPDAAYLESFRAAGAAGERVSDGVSAADVAAGASAAGASASQEPAGKIGIAVQTADTYNSYQTENPASVRTDESAEVSAGSYAACNELTYDKWARTYTVSLIMPFDVSGSPAVADAGQMDFYGGVLLALKDLKRDSGYDKYNLRVVDLKEWTSVPRMISGCGIEESDLIIGPVSPEDLSYVAEFGRDRRIPVVSPLDVKTESLAEDNPYLFIFPASASTVTASEISKFSECVSQERLVVIFESGTELKPIVGDVISALDSAGVSYRRFDYGILEGRNVQDHLLGSSDTTAVYKVMVASDNEAFVADALRNLNVLANRNYKISVYGFPKWRTYESVEVENLHVLNTHITVGYYVDYHDSAVSDFVKKYEEVFHTSPSPYAFQGYDIMHYFLTAMEEYGAVFPVKVNGKPSSLTQSDVLFVPVSPAGGFRNEGVREVVYLPDWKIEVQHR